MKYDELMSKLFGFSIPTYYNWKKENRPIINFVNSFSDEQINEFLEYGKFLNNPKKLHYEYKNQVIKFIDIITKIGISIEKNSGEILDDEIEEFLNVLAYTIYLSHCSSYSYKIEDLKLDMIRYYDDYRKLYNLNTYTIARYIEDIDELNIPEIDFYELLHNDFGQLIFYATTYNIQFFNIILKFYLKFIFFTDSNKEFKINEIYKQTKAHYQNKKTGQFTSFLYLTEDKPNNYTLIFNFDLFKKLVQDLK